MTKMPLISSNILAPSYRHVYPKYTIGPGIKKSDPETIKKESITPEVSEESAERPEEDIVRSLEEDLKEASKNNDKARMLQIEKALNARKGKTNSLNEKFSKFSKKKADEKIAKVKEQARKNKEKKGDNKAVTEKTKNELIKEYGSDVIAGTPLGDSSVDHDELNVILGRQEERQLDYEEYDDSAYQLEKDEWNAYKKDYDKRKAAYDSYIASEPTQQTGITDKDVNMLMPDTYTQEDALVTEDLKKEIAKVKKILPQVEFKIVDGFIKGNSPNNFATGAIATLGSSLVSIPNKDLKTDLSFWNTLPKNVLAGLYSSFL